MNIHEFNVYQNKPRLQIVVGKQLPWYQHMNKTSLTETDLTKTIGPERIETKYIIMQTINIVKENELTPQMSS